MRVFGCLFCLMAALGLAACGDGSVIVDPSAGNASDFTQNPGGGSTGSGGTDGGGSDGGGTISAEEFFQQEIFSSANFQTCASSGCHLVNNAARSRQTFFQIDPNDFSASYQWISVRKDAEGNTAFSDYSLADPREVSKRLVDQMDSVPEHQTFRFWTAQEENILRQWVATPE